MLDAKSGRGKLYVRAESKISGRCGYEMDEVLEERRVRQDGGANKLKEQLAPFAIFFKHFLYCFNFFWCFPLSLAHSVSLSFFACLLSFLFLHAYSEPACIKRTCLPVSCNTILSPS